MVIPDGFEPLHVAALDGQGTAMWIGDAPPVIEPPAHRRAIVTRWSTWSIVSGVALATGGLAAWRFTVAQHDWDQQHRAMADFTDLRAIERRGTRGVSANIAFGVGAATGITALVLYLRQRHDDDEPRLTAGPGVGAGVEAHF